MNLVLQALIWMAGLGAALYGLLRLMALFVDRPSGTPVVVDRRTYRLVTKRITDDIAAGRYPRAHYAAQAALVWLRQEVVTGPARHRAHYAAAIERLEAVVEQYAHRMAVGSSADGSRLSVSFGPVDPRDGALRALLEDEAGRR